MLIEVHDDDDNVNDDGEDYSDNDITLGIKTELYKSKIMYHQYYLA